MDYTPHDRERLFISDPTDRRFIGRGGKFRRPGGAWDRIAAVLTDPDLTAVIMFCLIGLLLTAVLIRLVPNFGDLSVSLQRYL